MSDVPDYDEFVTCERPECLFLKAKPMTGLYGMLGGGMGPYTVCAHCGDLLTKSQDTELCESHEATEIKNAEEDKAAHAVEQDGRPDLDEPA